MRTLLVVALNALVFALTAQNVQVTFRVDMSNETVADSGVHVAGNFQEEAGYSADWQPGETALTDIDGDDVFEVTVNIPTGIYFYKFINGDSWGSPSVPETPGISCAINDGGGNYNRQVDILSDTILPVIRFNDCNANITFRVSMKGQSFSADSVFVVGNFENEFRGTQDWSPMTTRLIDYGNDSIFVRTISVPRDTYSFLYANGNYLSDSSNLEVLSTDCAIPDGSNYPKRQINANEVINDLQGYCFSTCDTCQVISTPEIGKLHWWNDAVFYEIFVRSFYDSDGDGIGDFQGIIEKMDYLNDGDSTTDRDLGITGIWLMPMNPSPSYHGYDVTDYRGIHPDYGTMADFEEFLQEAHERGISVIMDYVMNHSSNQHPWFLESRSDTSSTYRDWYVWSDTLPDFQGPFGGGWHSYAGNWYYGAFWSGMPDLNYHTQAVRDEMNDIATFWLDTIGIDGFRLDAIRYLGEDGDVVAEAPTTFNYLREFNDHYKSVNPEAFTVGEVWTSTSEILPYVANGDMIDFCFEFDLLYSILNSINSGSAGNFESKLQQVLNVYPFMQYAPFISNHDLDRVYEMLGQEEDKMKLAASIYLTLPGVPFIYYGEEVAMLGSGVDENKRKPMQWTDGPSAGFTNGSPWYGINGNFRDYNVSDLRNQPNSLWNTYRKLVQSRNKFEVLRRGKTTITTVNQNNVSAVVRHAENEAVITVANFNNSEQNNLTMSLDSSDLSAGTYVATDLLNGNIVGDIVVNSSGGFSNWTIDSSLAAQSAMVIRLADTATKVISTMPRVICACGTGDYITIYPNPSDDRLFIEHSTERLQHIKIHSIDGRLVRSITLDNAEISVNVSDLMPGLYLVEVRTETAIETQKIVIR